MKNRILTGWNFQRVLFVTIGSFMVVQSVLDKQWWSILFGGYFVAMGIFAFGCASGNCYNNNYTATKTPAITTNIDDTTFEEIKNNEHGNN